MELKKLKNWKIAVPAAVLAMALLGGILAFTHPELRTRVGWRVELIAMKLRGDLVDMSWGDVFQALYPDGPYRISDLLATGNPNRSIKNRHTTTADVAAGEEIFRNRCAGCHGVGGTGLQGPDLTTGRFQRGASDYALYRTTSDGIPGTAMLAADLTDRQVWQVVAYVRSLAGVDAVDEPEAEAPAPSVSHERLIAAAEEPGNWLTYSGDYSSQRYSRLDRISRSNVADLQVAWVHQLETVENAVEATPLVVDGVMYLTEPPNNVIALDAATGQEIWKYERRLPRQVPACCGLVNRGVALLGDRVYLGTLDAQLVALDARTGELLWDVSVADHRAGHSITAAPLAVKDRVIVGIAGGEYGIRGFLDAYDAETGERLWRFWTVPGPDEPGHDTWAGDSWKTGGAPTWVTGSYDPELNLVYWGVGNPGPPFDGSVREGDNLYTNSVIALDADTGELEWYFQFTPHDEHDWDANQIPILVDGEFRGEARKLMLWANRNAFFYVLDRETGEFLDAREFSKQSWAEGIDSAGRPIKKPNISPSPGGTLIWPGIAATNWWSPSYSPRVQLLYVPVRERAQLFFSGPTGEHNPGDHFLGSGISATSSDRGTSFVRALSTTGERVWDYRLPESPLEDFRMGGVLSTAGDLVFASSGDLFMALDSRSGEELWRFATGGRIAAAPMSYTVDARQHVAIAAGRLIFSFALSPGKQGASP